MKKLTKGKREFQMAEIKGYPVPDGYMGLINGRYRLFATQSEYLEILREEGKGNE